MWVRMRIDIRWRDLAVASRAVASEVALVLARRLHPLDWIRPVAARHAAEARRRGESERTATAWSAGHRIVVTLSVRSAFDLLLRSMNLPPGSEVILSSLNIRDMADIVRGHDLVVVPIDVDADGTVSPSDVALAITTRSRLLVVAQLFGARNPQDRVARVARAHGLVVVEDCAQGFHRAGDPGDTACDVSLFSFGPIKTATALGGGVARVESESLHRRMQEILSDDPVQSTRVFARRVIRFAAIKAVTGRLASAVLRRVVELAGGDFERLAGSLARGFAPGDLFAQIRRQPSVPLLTLLRRRWATYPAARIKQRIRLGRLIDAERQNRPRSPSDLFWVYPVFTPDPERLCDTLGELGFDATRRSRMTVITADSSSATESESATAARWKNVVFVPWYPELSEAAVRTLALHTSVRAERLPGDT